MADGNVQRAGIGTNERLSSCLSSCTTGSGILPPVGETLYAALALDVTRMSPWNALTLMSNRPPFARLTVRGFGGSCSR